MACVDWKTAGRRVDTRYEKVLENLMNYLFTMKKSFIISVFVWMCTLTLGTSCSTTSTITYDCMVPADITLPVELASVGIVNHTPDSLYDLSSKATRVMAQDVADAQYFNDVHLLDSVIVAPMTPQHVDDLARFLEVDFLASLDSLELMLVRSTAHDKPSEYESKAHVHILAKLHLYLPGRDAPMTTMLLKDTLNWYGYGADEQEASDHLPNLGEIALESTIYVGEKLADKLAPHWTTVTRALFVSEAGELKEAAVNIHDDQWDKAKAKWENTYKKTNSTKLKAYCAYDLAVYYEKESEIDKAIEWITISAKHFKEAKSHKATEDAAAYLVFLQNRKKELTLLDLQFAE